MPFLIPYRVLKTCIYLLIVADLPLFFFWILGGVGSVPHLADVVTILSSEAAMLSTRIQLHGDLLLKTFRRFDKDSSGYITVENLKEVLGLAARPVHAWNWCCFPFCHWTAKGASGMKKRQIVKKCQDEFRNLSTIFAQGKKRHFSRGTNFPAPFGGLWFWRFLSSLILLIGSLSRIFHWTSMNPEGPMIKQKSISLETFNLDRNFQSRSKISISTSRFPHKKRAAVGGSLEIFILARNFQSRSKSRTFWSLGPLGKAEKSCFGQRKFWGSEMPFKDSVFEASKLLSTKTLLLKHYCRCQGKCRVFWVGFSQFLDLISRRELAFNLPQKESGKRSLAKKWRKKWQKRQKKWPKSDRKRPDNEKKVIELLLPHSFCSTLTPSTWQALELPQLWWLKLRHLALPLERELAACQLSMICFSLLFWIAQPFFLVKEFHQSWFLGRGSDEALFSENKGFSVIHWKGGRDSVNEGFGKDFYRKGNSVKRSGPFSEPPDSENWKVAVQIHFPKISS